MSKWIFPVILAVGFGCLAQGQEASSPEMKQEALNWIDRFAIQQVLFSDDDVQKLRKRVAGMTDEEVQKWWVDTADRRKLLDSPEWAETREWLKEFLDVQAIYSENEIKYFQSENFVKAQESPRELKEVMDEINSLRRRLREGARISAATRQSVLASRHAYQQEAVRQREAAALHRNPPPTFGTGQEVVPRPTRVRYNEPLVTSIDAARWSILRSIFPRW